MRLALALLATLLPATAAQALSCVRPADYAGEAAAIVRGEVLRVDLLRTYQKTAWPGGKPPVTVREYRAQVRTLESLRGSGPATLTYRFRDRKVDCDFAPSVKPGEQLILTLPRRPSDAPATAAEASFAYTPQRWTTLLAKSGQVDQ